MVFSILKNTYIVLHVVGESKDVKGLIGKHHVLLVVNGGHSEFALGHVPVVPVVKNFIGCLLVPLVW